MSPVAGIGLVLGLLAGLMLAVRTAQRRRWVGAELARKLVHLGMGTVCLAFPWIFHAIGPVWTLGVMAAGGLIAVRSVPILRKHLGGVLGGVDRASWGDIYFPFSVALVFALAAGNPAAFCAPVAILTYADAAGALVGQRWGKRKYRAVESMKSIEGSTAVFVVTCVSVLVVVGLWSNARWPEWILTSVIIGAFAALVEAVSWRGLDNLLVPIVAAAQMRIYPQLTWPDLAVRAGVMAALVIFMLTWRSRLLHFSARLGGALVLYVFWSLGGWPWLVAPAALLLSYVWLTPVDPKGSPRYHLAAVLCIGSAGIVWAGLNAWLPTPIWLWLFTLGFTAQQSIIVAVRFSQARPRWPRWQWWALGCVQAVTIQALAYAAANRTAILLWYDYAGGMAAVAIALAGFMIWDRAPTLPETLNASWWRQGITAVLASIAGFAVIAL